MKLVNGKENAVEGVPVDTRGRIYQVTPDGSQWEVRIHLEADVGMGKEIIGEVVFRSFNGGLTPLMGAATEAPKLAVQLIKRIEDLLRKEQSRIVAPTGLNN